MKKITTLALIICSAFIFSACLPKKDIDNTASTTITFSQAEATSLSLRQLLAKNIAQKCVWQTPTEEGSGQGELIISGKKFKQTVKVEGPLGESEFISLSDGEWFYTWSNNSATDNTAFKMKMDELENSQDSEDSQVVSGQIDLDKEYSYNCQPIVVKESDLSVPTDVNFVDFTEFLKQFQQ